MFHALRIEKRDQALEQLEWDRIEQFLEEEYQREKQEDKLRAEYEKQQE